MPPSRFKYTAHVTTVIIPCFVFLILGAQCLFKYDCSGEPFSFVSPIADGRVGPAIRLTVSQNLRGRLIGI